MAPAPTATTTTPFFWAQPIRYLRYASHVYPARFWSVAIGLVGFPIVFVTLPARKMLGYENGPAIPKTWPMPNRKREPVPSTYDD